SVAPGGTAEVTLKYDPLATAGRALQLGSVTGAWSDGTGAQRTVSAAVALTVLDTPPAPKATAARPQLVSSNEVHFISPAGSTPPSPSPSTRSRRRRSKGRTGRSSETTSTRSSSARASTRRGAAGRSSSPTAGSGTRPRTT